MPHWRSRQLVSSAVRRSWRHSWRSWPDHIRTASKRCKPLKVGAGWRRLELLKKKLAIIGWTGYLYRLRCAMCTMSLCSLEVLLPAANRTALQRGQHAMHEELETVQSACQHLQASNEGSEASRHARVSACLRDCQLDYAAARTGLKAATQQCANWRCPLAWLMVQGCRRSCTGLRPSWLIASGRATIYRS